MTVAYSRASALTQPARAALERATGVSRVARVTGLDRTNVEVACAVRPGGHVLQVTNGKGASFEEAASGAVLEAAELFCAEVVLAEELSFTSAAALARCGRERIAPEALPGGRTGEDALPLAWREGRDLASGASVLVPAAAVHAPPAGSPLLGASGVRWTSNGMGAHPSWPAALRHALLEAVERDGLARSLPDGWTERQVRTRRLECGELARSAPRADALRHRVEGVGIEAGGLEVHLFDLTPAEGTGLPVGGALLFDDHGAPIPLTAGYACALELDDALCGALLEAAQSRLTDIHGAREDVQAGQVEGVERLRTAFRRARERKCRDGDLERGRDRQPAREREPDRDVRLVVRRLRRAGFRRCVALDLAPAGFPVHVAKVVVPGLLVSELL